MKICVLSPHQDDAVLSCADHILFWNSLGYDVRVVTMFTKFLPPITKFSREYVKASGFTSIADFSRNRKLEDMEVMKQMNVAWEHLNFIDAGFRRNKSNQALYTQQRLFSGCISKHDITLIHKISRILEKYINYDFIINPMAIGKHIDHVLVRKACEQVFPKPKMKYYLDFPYAVYMHNWSISHIMQVVLSHKSLKSMSVRKKRLVNNYSSQIPLLFPKFTAYPELIVW